MLHRFASIRGLVAAAMLALSIASPQAQDARITLLENTDLPGFDYSTIKDTDLDACSAACSADNICRAFTFNADAN